jgi:hypothetical protein
VINITNQTGYRNTTNQFLQPLRGLVPEVETANKKHNFSANGDLCHGKVGRKFTCEFKGAAVRRLELGSSVAEVPRASEASSAAQTAEEGLELVGEKSALLKGFGHPPTHPLGETYHTAVPLRFGDYFGKMHLVPVSSNLTALRGKHVDHPDSWNCVKDSLVTFFQTETAVWELRVQLCTDLTRMPVEDASVEWDEHLSPSLTIARVTVQPQNAYSKPRRVWVDEQLSF